jgi:hypothetical protein
MPTFTKWLETEATAWRRGERELLNGYDFVRAFCWLGPGERRRWVSEPVRQYVAASYTALGQDGYDHILHRRIRCSVCGRRYRIENLRLCVECDRVYCRHCATGQCGCGGPVVG